MIVILRKNSPSPLTGQASKSELAGIIVRNFLSALTGHASKSDFGIENSRVDSDRLQQRVPIKFPIFCGNSNSDVTLIALN